MTGKRRLWQLLFFVYAAGMLYLLLFSRSLDDEILFSPSYWLRLQDNMNFIPFRSIRILVRAARYYLEEYDSTYYLWFAIWNIGGNFFLFIPLGFFLPALWRPQRRFWLFLLTVCGSIAIIEITQLLSTLGSLDIDDLILNTLGAVAGYGVWLLARRAASKSGDGQPPAQ